MANGWSETTLGAVATDIAYGYTESASEEKVGPKFLRITDIQDDFINWESVPYCPISKKDHQKYKLEIGDVVIARTGNSTGATATIKKEVDAVFASYLIRFKIDAHKANYLFIDFLLRSENWKAFVKSVKGGSAQGGANAKNFAEFPILLPPLPEQKAIAAILSSFDDKIELLRRQNKTLENIAGTIYKEWFVNFTVNGEKLKLNSKTGLPEGWRVESIGKLIDVRDGTHDSPKPASDGYYLITSRHLNQTGLDFGNAYLISKIDYEDINKRSRVNRYDILISMIGTVGMLYFVLDENINYAIKNIGLFKTSQRLEIAEFIYLFLNSTEGRQHIQTNMAGTTQSYVTLEVLRGMPLIVPSNNILRKFKAIVEPIFRKYYNNNYQIQTLSRLRDALLPKLMKGEIRIKG